MIQLIKGLLVILRIKEIFHQLEELKRYVAKSWRSCARFPVASLFRFFTVKIRYCALCSKYLIFADTLAHAFRYDVHEKVSQNPRLFFFVLRVSALEGDGSERFASRRRSRETWEIASDSPFCPCLPLCIADYVYSTFEPRRSLQREWREKLSFSPVYFSSPLKISFSNVSHPEAIYLICFSMRKRLKILFFSSYW